MTEIRVDTSQVSEASSYRANIQLQGFAAGDGERSPRSRVQAKDPGAGANAENSVKIHSSSVRSEPDLDTIMPLPGAYAHVQSSPWSVRSGGAGGRYHEESDGSSEEEADVERSLLPRSPRSIGFTNVEVSALEASLSLAIHHYLAYKAS